MTEEKPNLRKLYIRNLAFEVEQLVIRQAFEQYGQIKRCDVPLEKPGKVLRMLLMRETTKKFVAGRSQFL